MADDIVFDEQSLSVVDSWIDRNGDNATSSSGGTKNARHIDDSAPSTGKVGLGFKGKIEKPKDDALAKRLDKSKQKKRRAEVLDGDDGDDESDGELHGIVEKFPLSKTGSTKKVPVQPQKKSKPETVTKDKIEAVKPNIVPEPKKDSSAGKPQDERSKSNTTPAGSGDAEPQEKFKRKRKKTRSKQKNIRRDNRPEDKKPEYLKMGSVTYQGRELTEETRRILGVTK